jgi:hypothetical protein
MMNMDRDALVEQIKAERIEQAAELAERHRQSTVRRRYVDSRGPLCFFKAHSELTKSDCREWTDQFAEFIKAAREISRENRLHEVINDFSSQASPVAQFAAGLIELALRLPATRTELAEQLFQAQVAGILQSRFCGLRDALEAIYALADSDPPTPPAQAAAEPIEQPNGRPCYERDHHWLEMYNTIGSDWYHSPAKISEWYNQYQNRNGQSVEIDTVKEGIKRAQKESRGHRAE